MSDTEYDENGAAEEFVELDLDKTLTWTGNAVIVQRGTVFRMPLLVPYPSVLAIQFEVEGGYDIEFSLTFKDDHEQDSSVLVEPVRVSDREGQLDIDTTGVCEIIWSNEHSWISSKTLSYQLQLAPKLDVRWRKRQLAALTAATDFRMLAAVEMAEKVEEDLRSLKTRTADLQQSASGAKERTASAHAKHERYLSHVRRLEEEVAAAKQHADAAAQELKAAHAAEAAAHRSLVALQRVRQIDDGLTPVLSQTLEHCDEQLAALYGAYAGSLYAPEEGEEAAAEESGGVLLDRAEFLHFLQDFELLGRGTPPQLLCGVFSGCPQQLTPAQFRRCFARAALALAPEMLSELEHADAAPRDPDSQPPTPTGPQKGADGNAVSPPPTPKGASKGADSDAMQPLDKLLWLLRMLSEKARWVKLPVLEVRRRGAALRAIAELEAALDSLGLESQSEGCASCRGSRPVSRVFNAAGSESEREARG
mmetsp:Transcript_22557/g.73758  ORF Transcript_22557/g.73758 Transcript_22557/m.73758 type:complete len:478 (+) Transcript_22557:38-1471(+)